MSDMPMPGSRAMSIAVSVLMMVAMMLPSSALMLRRDRQLAGRRGEPHLLRRVAIVGAGYFLVWIAISAAAVPLGSMLAHVGPIATSAIVFAAGVFQFTSRKARQLEALEQQLTGAGAPFRQGFRLGISLRSLLWESDGDLARARSDGPVRDGGRDDRDYSGTSSEGIGEPARSRPARRCRYLRQCANCLKNVSARLSISARVRSSL
jgi:hypothetical protein